jgi:PIN domain nuclease of toxin-antitoxin system
VKLLLDTHVVLWWLSDDDRLSADAVRQLSDSTNQALLSAAVVWEIAIKRSLGKLQAPADVTTTLLSGGVRPLAVSIEHAAAVQRLPWHHRDPFDRVLIAQAELERAALVTADASLAAYGVPIVW